MHGFEDIAHPKALLLVHLQSRCLRRIAPYLRMQVGSHLQSNAAFVDLLFSLLGEINDAHLTYGNRTR